MPRAEANARRQATPEQWAAYRALWDGCLPDDASFRRDFETVRPLYFHDKALAAAAKRRASGYPLPPRGPSIRPRARIPDVRLPPRAPPDRLPDPGHAGAPRLDWICPVHQAEEIHKQIPQRC